MDTKPLKHASEFDALCDDARTRIKEVSPQEAMNMLAGEDKVYLIDVRERDEFDRHHIGGAVFLSKGWAEAKIHTVVPHKDDRILLYCGGGNRSALVADNLQKMGYGRVFSMAGGIKAWVNDGHDVTQG